MISYFRYVNHDQVEAFLKKGWVVADTMEGTPHGFYSILMKWMGEGEPKDA